VSSFNAQDYHRPVMPEKVIEYLKCASGKVYVDCTLGGGGHSELIAASIGTEGLLISLDVDEDAINCAGVRLKNYQNVKIIKSNFINLPEVLKQKGINQVDGGILVDLGVSTHQLTSAARGFTFSSESQLDMRMDKDLSETACDLIYSLNEVELSRIFFEYGEERYARQIARKIKETILIEKIETTTQLANLVKSIYPGSYNMRIHPATRVFQALRIAVNKELENLETFLGSVLDCMAPGSRLAIISFHSLEDRIVKKFYKYWATECICPVNMIECRCNHEKKLSIITKKPLTADEPEVKLNPSSRSAKLRVAERL
jgi:16S rRNA (cytosine1402-N4)-methyltransferase